jgi:hypothetical protein
LLPANFACTRARAPSKSLGNAAARKLCWRDQFRSKQFQSLQSVFEGSGNAELHQLKDACEEAENASGAATSA